MRGLYLYVNSSCIYDHIGAHFILVHSAYALIPLSMWRISVYCCVLVAGKIVEGCTQHYKNMNHFQSGKNVRNTTCICIYIQIACISWQSCKSVGYSIYYNSEQRLHCDIKIIKDDL